MDLFSIAARLSSTQFATLIRAIFARPAVPRFANSPALIANLIRKGNSASVTHF